ncbi:P-loop containing nucleoside triphosphate hydrolase protein [Basidiobolus meristosporus CBS 931.73]|uniref:p-loop containing nucleoside triphosphate hydrolase protein n=1 Tax=Basidiobolus meristosporus CBS 931.73 TaxID=1314790 RepID=A0A1Y1ZF17_9FUNG|nr:P-loop containing nucleoside triphosphate hydrolase protein [Basidiobolus meristosporus CBS 931.73]|eukprot:ORY08425.1 P-loop containing nucleoside triphosphate hydrolase protein [Basidiobolus meristosporus CBS 931.73]
MIDLITVLTKSGIVLWSKSYASIQGSPINSLVKEVLIEERGGDNTYTRDSYVLNWTFANELDLVFVIVNQKILQLTYIDELLETVKQVFCKAYGQEVKLQGELPVIEFDNKFETILQHVESKDAQARKSRVPKRFEETKKFNNTLEGSKVKPASKQETGTVDPDEIAKNIEALRSRKSPKMGGKNPRGKKVTQSPTLSDDGVKKGKKKELRVWDDGKVTKSQMERLDYSNKEAGDQQQHNAGLEQLVDRNAFKKSSEEGIFEVQDLSESEESDFEIAGEEAAAPDSRFMSFFKSVTGQKVITEEDLRPVLAQMKEHLIKKNVAADISAHLCESVSKSIVGQKLGSFDSLAKAVKRAMESALKRILTPRTSVDLLRDIAVARQENRPYSIVFIGVNGVGKSTNLSKTCFWLLQNKMKVLIAACDTFRSGAVEQLRVHARNLKALEQNAVVDLFERGYGKDSATIAKEAIAYGKNADHPRHFRNLSSNFPRIGKTNGYDVVLIDTAGRMQDNEPLMRALAKLVSVNNPDKIIFVGEALVGNEAVDQLKKFNQALKDFSGLQNPRHIDGIILTKFDTIDDKVGAALSMTFTTGQPILFVGTGQTYTDLKNMRVGNVVQALLKD